MKGNEDIMRNKGIKGMKKYKAWKGLGAFIGGILALCLIFPLLLTDSANTKNPASTTGEATADVSDATTGTMESTEIALVSEGAALYSVVVPSGLSSFLNSAARGLFRGLSERFDGTGVEFRYTDDFIYPNTDPESFYEIVVGDTNRAASEHFMAQLEDPNDYIVAVWHEDGSDEPRKIVIAARLPAAMSEAIEKLLAMIEISPDGKTATLPLELDIRGRVETSERLVLLTNQKASKLQLYDISNLTLDSSSLVWEYATGEYNIAGIKTRLHPTHGQVVLAAYGASSALMVTYPAGELVFSVSNTAANPHSVEYIPTENGGVICVASSTGNELRFYDESKSGQPAAASVEFTDSHGVLFDPEGGCLWAVGRTSLRAYTVEKGADGSITVTPVEGKSYTIPTDHAHDLAPVYGDTNLLWVTTSSAVYQFNKATGLFTTSYEGIYSTVGVNRGDIKGIGNFADGTVISLYPDGAFKSWTTRTLRVFSFDLTTQTYTAGSISGEAADCGFYKCRVFEPAYQ